jgi:hypothetical protein
MVPPTLAISSLPIRSLMGGRCYFRTRWKQSGLFHSGFISCITAKLGYFEYEDMKSAYLLKK